MMEDFAGHPGTNNESPQFVKLSLASAMTLDLAPGRFHRGATNPCINLLLTYAEGCSANCSYCGLARERAGCYSEKSFINVDWPCHPLDEVISRIRERERRLKRVCLSMITNARARVDSVSVISALHGTVDLPLSVLIAPTLMDRDNLEALKEAGADRVGIALDAVTEDLFDQHRGRQVKGPHRWNHYWSTMQTAADVFGAGNTGIHIVVGLGETEAEMVSAMRRVKQLGASIHLFSFYPENGSALSGRKQPPIEQYRRMQLARYLIENFEGVDSGFVFDETGCLMDFGLPRNKLDEVISESNTFMTSGCPGRDGKVACNRPYGNCLPGPEIRNYPFEPELEDIDLIRTQVGECSAVTPSRQEP